MQLTKLTEQHATAMTYHFAVTAKHTIKKRPIEGPSNRTPTHIAAKISLQHTENTRTEKNRLKRAGYTQTGSDGLH